MFFKEPTETRKLGLNWADWLVDANGDPLTISTSTWSGPAGITIDSSEIDGTLSIVRVSGGSWDELYELTNTIVAAPNGETENRSILISIQRSAPYCSPAEVREVATQITSTAQPTAWTNDVLEKLIERASRLFDMECGVEPGFFQASGNPSATERIFYGDGTNFLKLPPYVRGTLNTALGYPSGYSELEFVERGGYLVRTSSGILSNQSFGGWYENTPISVSAKWGYAETPADVKHAIIKLVIHICRTVDPTQLKLLVLEGQPLFQDRMPKDVIDLAKKYRWREAVLV